MDSKECEICHKDLIYPTNNQKYCDRSISKCWQIAKNTQLREKRRAESIGEGRICKRCGEIKYEANMRYYCEDCKKMINAPQRKQVQKKVIAKKKIKEKVAKIIKRPEPVPVRKEEFVEKVLPFKKKEETFKINPRWTQPLGSKKRK